MNKALKIINSAAFFGCIAVISLLSLLIPKDEFSETENRYLSPAPKFSAQSFFSGDFARSAADWLDDRFALRKNWISLHTNLELIQGRRLINGVYISKNRMMLATPEYDEKELEKSLDAIKGLAESVDAPVYFLLAPTAAEIYSEEIETTGERISQKRLIEWAYSRLGSDVVTIDIYDAMLSHKEDYIYYRTDHHWTSSGAYLAYLRTASAMGLTPSSLDRFNIMHASHGFYGSLHSRTLYKGISADTVDFYISNYRTVSLSKSDSNGQKVYESVFNSENLLKKDKYLCYLGENAPLVSVVSTAPSGRLLVIKDSYANCFVPFIAENYALTDVVDLRYVMNPNDYINLSDYDCILILYNAVGFAQDGNLTKLSLAYGG